MFSRIRQFLRLSFLRNLIWPRGKKASDDDGESWFSESVEYAGSGTFVYKDPKGTFSGPTRIYAGVDGRLNLEMSADIADIGDLRNPGWFLFFNGTRFEDDDGSESWGHGGGTPNVCERASVDCASAVFDVTRPGVRTDTNDPEASPIDNLVQQSTLPKLSISPLAGRYVAALDRPPKYWVLPLINFMGIDFRGPKTDLKDHPLRLHSGRGLCVFRYKGKPAFIEPVPECEERVNALKEREIRSAITAVMVGEVVDCSDIWSDTALPQPTQLLTALGLVDGTRVGTPWMEYRDRSGSLLARHHTRLGSPEFSRKNDLIIEHYIPHLLDCAVTQARKMDDHFCMAVGTFLSSLSNLNFVDYAFFLICSSIESLCKREKILEEDLIVGLRSTDQATVENLVLECKKQLISKARELRHQENRPQDAQLLEAIASNVANARYKSGKFGRKVERLLSHFGFRDIDLIANKFEQRYGSPWYERVTYFRSLVVHGDVFDDLETEIDEIWSILRHLQDIVARVLLNILEYDREYNPMTFPAMGAEKIDWVKDGIDLSSLGYDID